MRILLAGLLFLLLGFTACSSSSIAIIHANIVDVKNERLIADKTVLINGDIIEKIGDNLELPRGTKIINAKGKYLIPGFWDMHFHNMDDESSEVTDSSIIPLLIANGVTGVRDMFGLKSTLQRRDSIRSGKFAAPETYVGAMVDGPKPVWDLATAIADTARAIAIIDSLTKADFDFIKVYSLLPRDIYFAIANECKKHNIAFEGHVPRQLLPSETAAAGQKSMEHQLGMLVECSPLSDTLKEKDRNMADALFRQGDDFNNLILSLVNSFDSARLEKAAKIFLQNNTWYCPTIITMKNYFRLNKADSLMKSDTLMQYVTKKMTSYWLQSAAACNSYTKEDWNIKSKLTEYFNMIEKRLYAKNVNMLVGDDNNNPFCYAGFSLHKEMQELADCQLKDADVLKMATYNPAVFFNIEDKFGTVEENKIANLVLLNANPLDKISNTKKINAVFLRGKYFDRTKLNTLLNGVKEYCKRH